MIRRLIVIGLFLLILIGTIDVVERTACGPFEDCPYSEWRMRRSADKLPDLDSHLYSIWASEDGDRIVAGGSHLTLYESNDKGETWARTPMRVAAPQANARANNNDVIGIVFTGKRGIALLRSGEVLELESDGTLWRENPERSKAMAALAPLKSAQLDNGGTRSVVDSDGTVFETIEDVRQLDVQSSVAYGDWMVDPGGHVQAHISNDHSFVNGEKPEALVGASAIAAAPPVIVVVGAGGTSAISANGGRSWSKHLLPSREDFNTVWLNRRGSLALAAGDNGVILRSADGGEAWRHVTFDAKAVKALSGSSRPPLWAFAINVVTFLVALWLTWRRPVSKRREPIERLKERLRSDRPIETERSDQLGFTHVVQALANLVRSSDTSLPIVIAINGAFGTGKSSISKMVGERLRKHELKIVWFDAWHHQSESDLLASLFESVRQSIGFELEFRLKLIWIRAGMKIIIALTAASVLAWWSVDLHGPEYAEVNNVLSTLLVWLPKTIARKFAIISAVYAGIQTGSSLTIFGIIQAIAATFRLPILDAPLGLRQRFNKAVGEVTKALGDQRLVIVIDDLDRADNEARKTVLSAINFITAAADCAFILSVNRTEMKDYETLLEKIVDLNVGVPVMQADQTKRLLRDETHSAFDWGAIPRHVRHVIPTIAIVIIVSLVLWTITITLGGAGPEPPWPSGAHEDTTASMNPATTAAVTPGVQAAAAPPTSPERAAIRNIGRQWPAAIFIILGVELTLLILFILVRPGTPPIRDSPAFTTALEIWSEVIHAAYTTPRAVKRFANRARFFALYRAAEKLSAETELSDHTIVAAVANNELHPPAGAVKRALEIHKTELGPINLEVETAALQALRVYWRGDVDDRATS